MVDHFDTGSKYFFWTILPNVLNILWQAQKQGHVSELIIVMPVSYELISPILTFEIGKILYLYFRYFFGVFIEIDLIGDKDDGNIPLNN